MNHESGFAESAKKLGMRKPIEATLSHAGYFEGVVAGKWARQKFNPSLLSLEEIEAVEAREKVEELPLKALELKNLEIALDARLESLKKARKAALEEVRESKTLHALLLKLSPQGIEKALDTRQKAEALLKKLRLSSHEKGLLFKLVDSFKESEKKQAEKLSVTARLEELKGITENASLGVGPLHNALQRLEEHEKVKAFKALAESKKYLG